MKIDHSDYDCKSICKLLRLPNELEKSPGGFWRSVFTPPPCRGEEGWWLPLGTEQVSQVHTFCLIMI